MFAEFRFQLGRLLPTSSYPTSWCDDRAVVERIMETAKTGLLQSNAEPCQTANCSLLTAQCHREISNNKRSAGIGYIRPWQQRRAHLIRCVILIFSFFFVNSIGSQFWRRAQFSVDRGGQLSTVQLRRLLLRRLRSSRRRNADRKDQSKI